MAKQQELKSQEQVLVLVDMETLERLEPHKLLTRSQKDMEFREELQHLLNRYGFDSRCQMHDFVLADYINKALYNLIQANRMEDIVTNG